MRPEQEEAGVRGDSDDQSASRCAFENGLEFPVASLCVHRRYCAGQRKNADRKRRLEGNRDSRGDCVERGAVGAGKRRDNPEIDFRQPFPEQRVQGDRPGLPEQSRHGAAHLIARCRSRITRGDDDPERAECRRVCGGADGKRDSGRRPARSAHHSREQQQIGGCNADAIGDRHRFDAAGTASEAADDGDPRHQYGIEPRQRGVSEARAAQPRHNRRDDTGSRRHRQRHSGNLPHGVACRTGGRACCSHPPQPGLSQSTLCENRGRRRHAAKDEVDAQISRREQMREENGPRGASPVLEAERGSHPRLGPFAQRNHARAASGSAAVWIARRSTASYLRAASSMEKWRETISCAAVRIRSRARASPSDRRIAVAISRGSDV